MSPSILGRVVRSTLTKPSLVRRPLCHPHRHLSATSTAGSLVEPTFNLTTDEKQLYDTALQFAVKEMRPYMAEWDQTEYFPRDVLRRSGDLGFAGLYIPEADGGSGLSRFDTALVFEALSQGCVSTSAMLSIHNMATNMINTHGSAELKARLVPALVSFDKMASYCLTEPGSGSDSSALATTAVRKGDYYIVNGTKAFISGGGESDCYVTMVRTGAAGPKGITCLVIEKDSPGLSFGKKEKKLGWNSQPTAALIMEDCKVPVANLVGEEGKGFNYAMLGINGGRLNISACSLGGAQWAMEETIRYVGERKQFKQELIRLQNIQFQLANHATDLFASRLFLRAAARRYDEELTGSSGVEGVDNSHIATPQVCAAGKLFVTEKCYKIIDACLQMHGGYGYLKDFPVQQLLRDTRVHRILEGTNEVMQMIIARGFINK